MPIDKQTQHSKYRQEQTQDSEKLHIANQRKTQVQVFNLQQYASRMVFVVMFFQTANDLRNSQKRLVYANKIKDVAENNRAGVSMESVI